MTNASLKKKTEADLANNNLEFAKNRLRAVAELFETNPDDPEFKELKKNDGSIDNGAIDSVHEFLLEYKPFTKAYYKKSPTVIMIDEDYKKAMQHLVEINRLFGIIEPIKKP